MKEKFNLLITDVISPLLKPQGFRKKGLNFYKQHNDLIFLINFQNSQGNTAGHTKFYINLGIHSTAIDQAIGKTINEAPKEHECLYRTRISSHEKQDGYHITAETDPAEMATEVSGALQTALEQFNSILSTDDLINLMIGKNGLNNYQELFEYMLITGNETGMASYVKGLHQAFGEEKRWSIFERNLNDLLEKHHRSGDISSLYTR